MEDLNFIHKIVLYEAADKTRFESYEKAKTYEEIYTRCTEIENNNYTVRVKLYMLLMLAAEYLPYGKEILEGTAKVIEGGKDCAFHCSAWRVLAECNEYPKFYATYYKLTGGNDLKQE